MLLEKPRMWSEIRVAGNNSSGLWSYRSLPCVRVEPQEKKMLLYIHPCSQVVTLDQLSASDVFGDHDSQLKQGRWGTPWQRAAAHATHTPLFLFSAVASRGKGMLGLYLAEPLLARSGRSGKHLRLWGLRASLQGRC